MLVSSFIEQRSTLDATGREILLDAYRVAIEEGYRFYSYGDCLLVR